MKNFKSFRKGFTLIELLVVIAILGLLASIIIVSLNKARGSARDAQRIAEINQMRKAVEIYYLGHNEYPHVNSTSMPTGWSNFVQYLKGDGLLTLNDYHKSLSLNDLSDYMLPTKAFASLASPCPPNVRPQDPQCECKPGDASPTGGSIVHSYGFVSSSNQNWQYYKLRTKLENTSNSVLRGSLTGDFAQAGDNGCNSAQGYYCIGNSNLVTD
jgi:prepilin-type N-terminal cleavage/methylation domain-containing protein